MVDKLKSALELLKELEEMSKKHEEVKVKTKEVEVVLIDYREQLKRYDMYAVNFDYVLYFDKSGNRYKEKLEKIVEALERMRPVRAKLLVKVDYAIGPDLEVFEDITGDVVDILEFSIIENVLDAPIFVGKGAVRMTRSGSGAIRSDSLVYIVNGGTRNGERIKLLAQRGGIEVLFTYGRNRDSGGYKVIEGIYFIPLVDIKKMLAEKGSAKPKEEYGSPI